MLRIIKEREKLNCVSQSEQPYSIKAKQQQSARLLKIDGRTTETQNASSLLIN